ncbi:MAG: hypothetical protein ACYDER_14485 [Ktedonobacteraceae bacterium]
MGSISLREQGRDALEPVRVPVVGYAQFTEKDGGRAQARPYLHIPQGAIKVEIEYDAANTQYEADSNSR